MSSTPDIAVSTGPTMTSLPTDPSSALEHLTSGTHSVTLNADYFSGLIAGNGLRIKSSTSGEKVFSTAQEVVEWVGWKKSKGGVWVFDDAEAVGVGRRTVKWAEEEDEVAVEVNQVQTREGAGSGLVGYLNGKIATSPSDNSTQEIITLYATTTTLPLLLPALAQFPSSSLTGVKIVIHLATTSIDPSTLVFKDSFAEVVTLLPSISGEKFEVVFSSTSDDIVETAAKLYGATSSEKHVVHVYESTYAARQVQAFTLPSLEAGSADSTAIEKFSTYGSISSAREIIILPASRTANILIASNLFSDSASTGAGLIVLNSWTDLTGLSKLIPLSGKGKKLFILNESPEGRTILKENVLAGLIDPEGSPSRFRFPNIKSIVVPSEGDIIDFVKESVPALSGQATPTRLSNEGANEMAGIYLLDTRFLPCR